MVERLRPIDAIVLFKERLQRLVPNIEIGINNERFISGINQSVNNVRRHLEELSGVQDCILITGGKSNLVTRVLLHEVGERSTDNTLRSMIDSLWVLGEEENKLLYEGDNYSPSNLSITRNYLVPPRLVEAALGKQVVFLDERLRTGEKIFHTLLAMNLAGFPNCRYVVFSSVDDETFAIQSSKRPSDWEALEPHLFKGTTDMLVHQVIDGISYLRSRYLLLRQKRQIVYSGFYYHVNLKDLDIATLLYLRKSFNLIRELKDILSKGR